VYGGGRQGVRREGGRNHPLDRVNRE